MTAPIQTDPISGLEPPKFSDVFTRVHVYSRVAQGVTDPADVERVAIAADAFEAEGMAFRDVQRAIESDRMLSDAGKGEKAFQAAQEGAKRLQSIATNAMAPLEADVARREKTLLDPQLRTRMPAGVDAADWRSVESEIRAKLEKLDPIERATMYRNAVTTGDVQFIRAVENAPKAFRLVDDAMIAEAAEAFAAARWPEDFEVLQEKRSALSTIKWNAKRAVMDFEKRVGRPIADIPLPSFRTSSK